MSDFTARQSIKNMINQPITVEGTHYNFGDMIETEWISDFPNYSHRMRSTFVKGAEIVDNLMNEVEQYSIEVGNFLQTGYETWKRNTLDPKVNELNRLTLLVQDTLDRTKATDTVSGTLTKNEVKELAVSKINELVTDLRIKQQALTKMQEFGIGLTTTSTGHRNDYKANGFYAYGWQGGGIGNKTTGVFNIQYADRYGVQLSITQEDKTRAFIRAKNNNTWTSDKELMQVDDFNLYANAYLGNSELKTLNGRNAVKVAENDILVYDTNNKRYYYKSKINGNITIPTEENTEKLMLGSGSGMGFEMLLKKLTTGTV
ncbi:hypothetical protein [Pseudostreptobacillus hongkongensis]|uniref:hypothetical protein n=1 Tax=Pseudostreptobacillus hongkongensis TaxID=1162717 RepID=UPI0008373D4C|nr:hypothetical protein [Pseudostreptobacillus hongkongensis]